MAANDFPKTIGSYPLLRVAELNGNRTLSGLGPALDPNPNQEIDPLGDNQGRQYVRLADQYGALDSLTSFDINAGGYVETFNGLPPIPLFNKIILQLAYGFNVNAAVRFLQFFKFQLAAPVANDVPNISILVPPSTNFSLQPGGIGGLLFAWTDIVNSYWIVSSTTGDIYTPSGTNDFWLNLVGRYLT